MASKSRGSSEKLEQDLSTPTISKKLKESETTTDALCVEEHLTEIESVKTLTASQILLGADVVLAEEEHKEFKHVAEASEQIEKIKQSERQGETSTSSSQKEQYNTFEFAVKKSSSQGEQSETSDRIPDSKMNIQLERSLVGEHAFYEDLAIIGNGAYGTVYKATDKANGLCVALKAIRIPLTDDGLPTSTLREIATLKQLDKFEHPHIVRLLDVCQGNYLNLPSDNEQDLTNRGLTLWLIFEHVERDLSSYITNCPPPGIPSSIIKQMSKDILCGVEFLHSHRIIHRDLKPQNLLVTNEGRIKIADFGLAKTYDFEMRLTSVVVTQWYRAPEVLLGCSYATPVDIWSVGCILAELCRLEPLFPGSSEGDQLDRIFQIVGTPSQNIWPENVSLDWTAFPYRQPKQLRAIISDLNEDGLDLLKNMLIFDPHSRITAAQALKHQYFSENDV